MKLKRTYYILRGRIHVFTQTLLEKVFLALSKIGAVVMYRDTYQTSKDLQGPNSAPDIETDRFVFEVSYIVQKVETFGGYWFQTKKGKRLFTMYENNHQEFRIIYIAQLKSFFAHFSYRHKEWVKQGHPGLSSCRYKFSFSITPDSAEISRREVLPESYRVLKSGLTSKIPEINKTLTGADNDGEMTSPKNRLLVDNIICRHCGYPVFASAENKYGFECMNHGEISISQADKVDPKTYERIFNNCLFDLEIFCGCPKDNTFRC